LTTQDVAKEVQSKPRLGNAFIRAVLKLLKSVSDILMSLSDGSTITYLLVTSIPVVLMKISLRVITQLVALIVL
jgi:hypothetical protein